MFNHREICFAILFVVVSSVSAVNCPKNETCSCEESELGNYEILCQIKNSSIHIQIMSGNFMKIVCFNWKWSDFPLRNLIGHEIRDMRFYMCDLPKNSSLSTITKMLGATIIRKLNFHSYKNITFLKKVHLKGFKTLQYLDLSYNNILYIEQDLLNNLPQLRWLILSNNILRKINLLFQNVPLLRVLKIENNILQSIEPGTFDGLKNLIILSLKRNNLTKLPSRIFDKLVKLKYLNLCSNNLTSLPEDIFGKLKSLEKLILSENNFTDLPTHLLQNNTNLQFINLSFNKKKLDTLPNGFFSNLTNLKTLKLQNNGFVSLPEDLLWGCLSLTTLVLSENDLDVLPVNISRNLKNLIELKIDSNNIKELSIDFFKNCWKLQKLDASKNHISSIDENVFPSLSGLEVLNMAENYLMDNANLIFITLYKLKIANFSNNYLTLNRKSNFFVYEEGISSLFGLCTSLEELYLANNHISRIFNDWNFQLPNLRKLDLKHNYISSLSIENLQFVSKNIEVDLTYNKIQHIFLNNAEEFLKHEGPHRAVILIDNNPLHCGCEIYDFLRYLEGKMDPSITKHLSIKPGNLTCRTLNRKQVTSLRSESFICKQKEPIFTSVCPKMCNCNKKMEQNIFIMDCARHNFIIMPNITRKPVDYSMKIVLNLSYNQLSQMPNLTELGLGSVTNLTLSYNDISEITLDGLSKTIEVLKLDNNNISKISSDVLNFLTNSANLTKLTLRGNPWICNCNTTDFLDFILTKRQIIVDLNFVTCYGENRLISNMKVTDFCPDYMKNNEKQSYNSYIILFTFIFIVGLIIFVYCYLYKLQLIEKLFAFTHRRLLEENELDEEKYYDVFVSYSQNDHDFVMNELVRELENGLTPLKLCLPYRDWLVNEWTTMNIVKSVEFSKQMMVVLSPSFLESIWKKTEFRVPLYQAMCKDQSDVILILYGDIEPTDEHLDLELRKCIHSNICIKWGDPSFWEELKQLLQYKFNLI